MPIKESMVHLHRRQFLGRAGTTALGIAGAATVAGRQNPAVAGPPLHSVRERKQADDWVARLVKTGAGKSNSKTARHYQPSVQNFAALIDTDSLVRMYVNQMIEQVPASRKQIASVEQLLAVLDHIVQSAPSYSANPDLRNTFPVSKLFLDMLFTPAGISGFRNSALNEALRGILKAWCAYLDSPASRSVLTTAEDGWLSPSAYQLNKLHEFVIPNRDAEHWGFESYNAYFHREIRSELRPIASPEDPKLVTSPNDGTVYKIARNVARTDSFWLKEQPYSLADMLDNHPLVDEFVGGDVLQSFLSGANYHRFKAPIAGEIVDVRIIDGLMFSELEFGGKNPESHYSQGFQATVNTRALVFIRSDDKTLGTVCVIPVGIAEVSSITITVKPGGRVEKGDEVGYFSYGGSTLCVVFQPGAVKHFTVSPQDVNLANGQGIPVRVNAKLATAN